MEFAVLTVLVLADRSLSDVVVSEDKGVVPPGWPSDEVSWSWIPSPTPKPPLPPPVLFPAPPGFRMPPGELWNIFPRFGLRHGFLCPFLGLVEFELISPVKLGAIDDVCEKLAGLEVVDIVLLVDSGRVGDVADWSDPLGEESPQKMIPFCLPLAIQSALQPSGETHGDELPPAMGEAEASARSEMTGNRVDTYIMWYLRRSTMKVIITEKQEDTYNEGCKTS